MFTGLVEGLGNIETLEQRGSGKFLVVSSELVAEDAKIGDSISVNGCCLTIVALNGSSMSFELGDETIRRTTFGSHTKGDVVNLERSLRVGDRMGGHFVSGHIDGIGTVDQRIDDDQWSTVWFRVPPAMTRQMVSKGSIAIDGISLTLVDVEVDRFSVMLIPHTLDVTTLGRRDEGDSVNLETDLLAKYAQKAVGLDLG
jgi:riboflavin synthase